MNESSLERLKDELETSKCDTIAVKKKAVAKIKDLQVNPAVRAVRECVREKCSGEILPVRVCRRVLPTFKHSSPPMSKPMRLFQHAKTLSARARTSSPHGKRPSPPARRLCRNGSRRS